MNRGVILELVPKEGFDFSKIVVDYANGRPVDLSKCDVKQHDSVIDSFKQDFIDYVLKYGFSSFMRRELITEEFVSTKATKSDIEKLLIRFLANINLDKELVIVDPYFFTSTKDQDYIPLIESIFDPFIANLETLKIITLPNKIDASIEAQIRNQLTAKNPTIRIEHKVSSSFHDRFWINRNQRKGFLSGTSLNGLGRRYALVDYLQPQDVDDIILALSNEGLL